MKKISKKIVVTILTWQARIVLKRYHPKIIAITGSVGKTSTKDAIFTILSKFKTVRKSDKSYNSEIGLPLTILGLPNGWNNVFAWIENVFHGFFMIFRTKSYPEYLVLEVGAGKPNDIKSVASWLAPDIVVITCFPDKPVHVEFFAGVDDIIEEKSSLAFALKSDGVLVLNNDDERVYAIHEKANRRTVSYGLHPNATYQASHTAYINEQMNNISVPTGISFKLEYEGNTFPVMLPHVVGLHNASSALAAIAVSHEVGCDLLASINAIAEYCTPSGRLTLIEGIRNSVIIDDTYNASPVAMEAAIKVLIDTPCKRKVAVLGDMLELGKIAEEAHREVGEKITGKVDILVTVGLRAKSIYNGAIDSGFPKNKIHNFDTSENAIKFMIGLIEEGDVILLKGSQGIRLEKVVEAIMAHPEDKTKLLCRQEKEWKNR